MRKITVLNNHSLNVIRQPIIDLDTNELYLVWSNINRRKSKEIYDSVLEFAGLSLVERQEKYDSHVSASINAGYYLIGQIKNFSEDKYNIARNEIKFGKD